MHAMQTLQGQAQVQQQQLLAQQQVNSRGGRKQALTGVCRILKREIGGYVGAGGTRSGKSGVVAVAVVPAGIVATYQ